MKGLKGERRSPPGNGLLSFSAEPTLFKTMYMDRRCDLIHRRSVHVLNALNRWCNKGQVARGEHTREHRKNIEDEISFANAKQSAEP